MTRLYHVAEQRNRRLERADRNISRCPECGAWQWRNVCTTDHDRAWIALDEAEDAGLDELLARVMGA